MRQFGGTGRTIAETNLGGKEINWDVIAYHQLCPTLALLTDHRMRNYCLNLLDKYGTYKEITEIQPFIDLIAYSTASATIYMRNKPR